LRDLETAFKRCFKKISKLPRFKKKGVNDSFFLEAKPFNVDGPKIKVPKIGWLKLSEPVPNCEIKSCTISRTANDWFISFHVPFEPENTPKQAGAVGVDLGIKTLATLSTGDVFANPRPFKKMKRKLKIAQRVQSKRFKKGQKQQSENYKKAAMRVAKIHQKIANIRKDALHKLTTKLAKNHSEIVIEDLNVKGMVKNHKLASAILDGGFFEFRRQMTYKTEWYGSKLTVADRWFASSKTCSKCGEKNQNLKLSDRIFKCQSCGHTDDRDKNAADNLEQKSVSYTASACGEASHAPVSTEAASVKQEASDKLGNVQVCVSFA